MAINVEIINNTIKSIKIVCGGMAATPKIAKLTVKYLNNKKITYENISKAKLIISREFSPLSDVRGSKNYRTIIVSNLLDRFWNEYNNKKVTVYDF
jgi:xanthine dehydrogenase small subunit